MLKKICSGGQTGADSAGLFAGHSLGIETGGWVPYGWRTDAGPAPWLARYGCRQHPSDKYPPRTEANVKDSDGTVWFGKRGTPGGILTERLCRDYGRPYLFDPTPQRLRDWLDARGINVLNVAGNRERINPEIGDHTFDVLVAAIQMLQW